LSSVINGKLVSSFEGDIRDTELIKRACENVDTIIHLAGISDGNMGKINPEKTKDINFNSLENIILTAKQSGVKKFSFASTFGVYGNQYKQILTEDLKPKPVDPYSESKLQCENLLQSYSDKYFETCSLRSAMVFGLSPNFREEFLVNKLTKIAFETEELTIIGGFQKRPQIHVNDLTDAFIKLVEATHIKTKAPFYNIVSSNPSLIEIVEKIKLALPKTKVTFLKARPNEDSFEMDDYSYREMFGNYKAISIELGIKELLLNYKNKKK